MKLAGAGRVWAEFNHELLDEPIMLRSITQAEKMQIIQNGKAARIGRSDEFDLQKLDGSSFQTARIVCYETDKATPYFAAGDKEVWDELPGTFVDALLKAVMQHTGLAGETESAEAKN